MEKILRGKIYLLPDGHLDNLNTDVIIPARYLTTADALELGKHAMEPLDPEFPKKCKDEGLKFIVAGKNFGSGSSREHAPFALTGCGIKAVIAKSYSRIFYRNSINGGAVLPIELDLIGKVSYGDELEIDLGAYKVRNLTTNKEYEFKPYPDFILNMIEIGGLVEYTKRKLEKR